ncbi:hypothetical protein ACO0LM_13465 [Undibacterium sp. Di26W]|uniref:hypothetical protein n=1 Tax=Undibacterium sp. Di26W TaxID=3413035 RepID=UPI003BF30459
MNGTKDPLVPYRGGEVNLLGLFYKCGEVLNARPPEQYFTDLNKITATPMAQTIGLSGVDVERIVGRKTPEPKLNLSQFTAADMICRSPTTAARWILSLSLMEPNETEIVWEIFAPK